MTGRAKALAYAAGTFLLLLSLVYVAKSFADNWATIERINIVSTSWLIASIAIYAVSHVTTGLAWPLAIRQLDVRISLLDGIRIGLIAQIGKYLPGNVAHYAGRGALATQFGISLKSSGISTAIEIGSALTALMLVAGIGLLIDPLPLAFLPKVSLTGAAILISVLFGMIGMWLWLYFRRGTHPGLLAGPTLCIAASFLLSSLSVYALSYALGYSGLSLPIAVGAFSLAWGAGFLVPGAPAGLGVREAVLLAMLGPTVGVGPAVVIALLHRLITAIVDAFAALLGYTWLASASLAKK